MSGTTSDLAVLTEGRKQADWPLTAGPRLRCDAAAAAGLAGAPRRRPVATRPRSSQALVIGRARGTVEPALTNEMVHLGCTDVCNSCQVAVFYVNFDAVLCLERSWTWGIAKNNFRGDQVSICFTGCYGKMFAEVYSAGVLAAVWAVVRATNRPMPHAPQQQGSVVYGRHEQGPANVLQIKLLVHVSPASLPCLWEYAPTRHHHLCVCMLAPPRARVHA